MGSIIYKAQNLNAEINVASYNAASWPPLNAFLAERKRQGSRETGNWVVNKRPDNTKFPMKCGACGDSNHVWSTCKALDGDVLRWTLAKRKHVAEKYAGQPPPTAHFSDVPVDTAPLEDADGCPQEYDMEDDYDDTAVSISFAYVAFA
jgi:hypothetical protein